ncbi:hypothetical protein [Ectobacillus funiculus]|uniref:hypothetical protein n=1 Tax=Ectobacillus funiculus TaxID=137993 RepID=UPI00196B7C26|nr:hypothetical protein [Ectobacillus funiculus]
MVRARGLAPNHLLIFSSSSSQKGYFKQQLDEYAEAVTSMFIQSCLTDLSGMYLKHFVHCLVSIQQTFKFLNTFLQCIYCQLYQRKDPLFFVYLHTINITQQPEIIP